jgi:hypothetical protein
MTIWVVVKHMSSIHGILNDKPKVVYTLLILYVGSEIRNWKLEIVKNTKDADSLPDFNF